MSQSMAGTDRSVKREAWVSPDTDAPMSDDEESGALSADESVPTQLTGDATTATTTASSGPLQKRRRVTRACDECRRKKIKCDGQQPCTHCQVYSYDCTYNKPSNRRRNPAPQYIEALENKLARAETLLRRFMPDVDLGDPNLDPSVQQEFRLRENARALALLKDDGARGSSSKDARLLSMISGVGQLDLDDKGDMDFHGLSSGTVFFKRMKSHFKNLLGRDYQIPFMPRARKQPGLGLDTGRSNTASSGGNGTHLPRHILPPKDKAKELCSHSIKYATCLLRIVHVPTFYKTLDNLYLIPTDSFTTTENRKLALIYSVMALGCMYNLQDDGKSSTPPYELAMEQGLKYYSSARALLQDLTECRDLTSLQALLFMILFIQAISSLSTCYGFVGIALRSALRMGLHRYLPHTEANPIEAETRRRVFYVCRQLDTYTSALLGFPLLLLDEDIDQPLPTPVDDEYITRQGILPVPPGTPSFFEAFNAHAELMAILGKIIKNIYPLKGIEPGEDGSQADASYLISYAKIKEMERSLQQWYEKLPLAWRPNPEGPDEVVRVRNLLRFAYAHVQMVLYRPFIHYVSPRIAAGKNVDDRAYACGAAGISVARNIVLIGTEMRKQVALVGPYWFTFFTEFFAIISLVFFVLENQDKPGTTDILADALAGKETICKLARRSMAADRIANALELFFDQLPENLKSVKPKVIASKKRSRPAKASMSSPPPSASRAKTCVRAEEASISSPCGSAIPSGASASSQSNVSYDPTGLARQDFGIDFSSSVPGMSPVDLGVTPEPIASVAMHDGMHKLQKGLAGDLGQIHRLEGLMFTSGDPLAYPNRPVVDVVGDKQLSLNGGAQYRDPSSCYTGLYDSIEGQLMGSLPPYLMQTQGQAGFELGGPSYSDEMLPLQAGQHQGQMQGRQLSQPHLSQYRQQAYYNMPWPSMFPSYN